MDSKHRKTLAAVFTDPVSGTIEWAAVESLLLAAGARLIEGRSDYLFVTPMKDYRSLTNE
jgi:hypothetical protein